MVQKLINVAIPNHNNVYYLGHAIQSVLNQIFTDYEIIVVDDGSSANSKDVVGSFGGSVRYIWQENKGFGSAKNMGMLTSETEVYRVG